MRSTGVSHLRSRRTTRPGLVRYGLGGHEMEFPPLPGLLTGPRFIELNGFERPLQFLRRLKAVVRPLGETPEDDLVQVGRDGQIREF